MLMKTQDMGYVLQKVQSEKKVNRHYAIVLGLIKRLTTLLSFLFWALLLMNPQLLLQKIEKLTAMLHSLDNQPTNRSVYYAEDRFVLPEILF